MVFTTEVGSFLPCDVQCLCVILWAGSSDSILTNRIWDCIIKKHTTVASLSSSLFLIHPPISFLASLPSPLPLPSSLCSSLASKLSWCIMMATILWRGPHGAMRNWDPIQHPMRKLSLLATIWNEFKRDPSAPVQSWLMTLLQFHQRFWARIIQLSLFCIPGPWNCKLINTCCCFKLLNFEVICYTWIDN